MARRKRGMMPAGEMEFWESAYENTFDYWYYYDRLVDIAISRFCWTGLPKACDPRYIELGLLSDGMMLYFKDESLVDEAAGYNGELCTRTMIGAGRTFNRMPVHRRAYTDFGYNAERTDKDSVLIFNNYLHKPSFRDISKFAKELETLDRIIDVNINAQKTPILIQADENDRLTMKNLYKNYAGNEPFIFSSKSINPDALKVLNTGAPFLADRLYDLRVNKWNEALTYLGISNVTIEKKERLITDEVARANGGTVASRYSPLEARKDACNQIKEMFGTDISVIFRDDINTDMYPEESVEVNEDDDGGIDIS